MLKLSSGYHKYSWNYSKQARVKQISFSIFFFPLVSLGPICTISEHVLAKMCVLIGVEGVGISDLKHNHDYLENILNPGTACTFVIATIHFIRIIMHTFSRLQVRMQNDLTDYFC